MRRPTINLKAFGKGLISSAVILFIISVLLPLVWVLIASLKTGREIVSTPWGLPASPQFDNYVRAWNEAGISRFFFNSIVITLGTLVILLPVGAMAAYIFARFPFKGSKLMFGGFLGGMMFPNFLIIIPLFFLLKSISLPGTGPNGLVDTKTGLILVYVAYSLSFTIFVLTGFFQTLPGELAEAAEIDGCNQHKTFWKVMFPLVRPGLLVVGIFNAIGLWNEYGLALVLLPDEKNHTLPLGIAKMTAVEHYQSDWGALFAGLVIVMLPVLIVYWIFRDKIQQTMVAGAVKG